MSERAKDDIYPSVQSKAVLLILILSILAVGITAGGILMKFQYDTILNAPPDPKLINQDQLSSVFSTPSPTPQATPTPKAIKQYAKFPGMLAADKLENKKVVIEVVDSKKTPKGRVEFEIYPEATLSASNFIFLANDGFYDGIIFHRVEAGFVVQTGDPLGNGTGYPGYKFDDDPVSRQYTKGTVAMANSGPNTNGSQFFITLADLPNLPPKYAIFGHVIAGQEVVDKIVVGDIMQKVFVTAK